MDGLSSEVRLNRTEVNNGCLVKGRSSQSGSYKKKKKKKEKRGKNKKQPQVFLRGSCQTPFVWACTAHSVTCHNYPSNPWIFQPQQVLCSVVCMCRNSVYRYKSIWLCVCLYVSAFHMVQTGVRACFDVYERDTGTDTRWQSWLCCSALSVDQLRWLCQHKASVWAYLDLHFILLRDGGCLHFPPVKIKVLHERLCTTQFNTN